MFNIYLGMYRLSNMGIETQFKYMNNEFYVEVYKRRWLIMYNVHPGMLTFYFFWKTIVSLWIWRQKNENETIVVKNDGFLKMFVSLKLLFQNDRFWKRSENKAKNDSFQND